MPSADNEVAEHLDAPTGEEGAVPSQDVGDPGEALPAEAPRGQGPWVEVCAKDASSGAWRSRPDHVLKHTQSTMHMISVEPTLEGKLLRIVLRGQFFLYNQIRLMVGTAVAIVAGVLQEEMLETALTLTTEMHMPMAPATGLLLRTAGFSRLDNRAGACAMDPKQAEECMLPSDGFVLMDDQASQMAQGFVKNVEKDMDVQWRESGEGDAWVAKMAFIKAPTGAVLEELRAMRAKVLQDQAEFRASQDMKDTKRREAQLDSLGERSSAGLLPRRFAADLMVRFRLVPGWRVNNIQEGLVVRIRQWHQDPSQKPPNMSMPPETKELLAYCASVGLDELSSEGMSRA